MRELTRHLPFPISVSEFFILFFSDESTFKNRFHEARGDEVLETSKWTLQNERIDGQPLYQRQVKFLTPTSKTNGLIRRLTGDTIEVHETQNYHFTADGELECDVKMEVMGAFGASLDAGGKFSVTHGAGNTCVCNINIEYGYTGSWFKARIEDFMERGLEKEFAQWEETANEHVAQYKESLAQQRQVQVAAEPREAVPAVEPAAEPTRPERSEEEETESEYEEFYDALSDMDEEEELEQQLHAGKGGREPSVYSHMLQAVKRMQTQMGSLKISVESTMHRIVNLEGMIEKVSKAQADASKQLEAPNLVKEIAELETKVDCLIESRKLKQAPFTWKDGALWSVFLVVWPIVACSLWKYARSFLERRVK